MTVTQAQRRIVQQRAGYCCEYCRLSADDSPVPFHVDHIIPLKHGGEDTLDNLCLACFHCNAHKSHDLTGFDPSTGDIARLFHPRNQSWNEHFFIQEDLIIAGLTAIGRTTAHVLKMNNNNRVESRQVLAAIDSYPCESNDSDPIE